MSSQTPPVLTAQTTVASGDLFLVWPVATAGPLCNITYANFKTQLVTDFGGTFLKPANNLSDVANPTTARTNLGLGTAATANIGTSGATIPALNTANTWASSQAFGGDFTRPNMPAFGARMNATVANVTGDNTAYSVIWDTELYDRGSNFDPTTGLFTVVTPGIYQCNVGICLSNVAAAHNFIRIAIVTSVIGATKSWTDLGDIPPDVNGRVTGTLAVQLSLVATQTVGVQITVGGSTKTVGVYGEAGQAPSSFSMHMIG